MSQSGRTNEVRPGLTDSLIMRCRGAWSTSTSSWGRERAARSPSTSVDGVRSRPQTSGWRGPQAREEGGADPGDG